MSAVVGFVAAALFSGCSPSNEADEAGICVPPQISVEPGVVVPGETIPITGQGFSACEDVDVVPTTSPRATDGADTEISLLLQQDDLTVLLGWVAADGIEGEFSVEIEIPENMPLGEFVVTTGRPSTEPDSLLVSERR